VISIFLLFFLQFVVLPFGMTRFETPKVILAELGVQALLVAAILSKKYRPQISKKFLPIAGIFALVVLGLVISQTPIRSLFGNAFRLQGAFLALHLLIWAALSSLYGLKKTPTFILWAVGVLLLQTLIIFGTNTTGRFIGTLGEGNALAGSVVFLLPFLVYQNKRWPRMVAILGALIIVALSGSRSGIIALGLELLFIGLTQLTSLSLKQTFIACLLIIPLTLVLPFVEEAVYYQKYNSKALYKFESRAQIWQIAGLAGLAKPILGWGFGNTELALHQTAVKRNNDLQYVTVDSSHNIFLDFWVEGGVVGLALMAWLLHTSIKGLLRQANPLYMSIFIGIQVVLLFNPLSVVNLLQYWWILGLGLAELT